MKKLLYSLLIGAVIMGVGIGVTMLEISHWEISDYTEYLDNEPLENCKFTTDLDTQQVKTMQVYVWNSWRDRGDSIEIVEDKSLTDKIVADISYRGQAPVAYSDVHTSTVDNAEHETLCMRIHPGEFSSVKQIRNTIEEMFKTKVFYRDVSATFIEKVTIYTAYPEKIEIVK